MMKKAAVMLCASALFAPAADPPRAEISSASLHAKLYLPDPDQGYYRATRFDWSGVIASLEWNGHNYFGQWFPRYDPKLHDAIMGPVEEFLTRGAGLGYDEARTGESFVKIGVGAVRKPEEAAFHQFNTYEITNSGKWTVHQQPDSVEFTQTLPDTLGYAYTYTKTVRLAADKPQLILDHRFRNTGRKTIETSVYEHNFYMLDGLPSGPEVVVKFPFEVHATANLNGMAETHGGELAYLRELAPGQSVYTELEGYGDAVKDYDIRVENRKAGIGVRQTSDRPLSKLVFWSIRTTACPEAYIGMRIEPGKEFTWRITYDFYALSAAPAHN
jgi:hypothetical protein